MYYPDMIDDNFLEQAEQRIAGRNEPNYNENKTQKTKKSTNLAL